MLCLGKNSMISAIRFLSEGNYEEAIIAFTAAIEIDPSQERLYIGRGDSYGQMAMITWQSAGVAGDALLTTVEEHLNNAISDYQKALELITLCRIHTHA